MTRVLTDLASLRSSANPSSSDAQPASHAPVSDTQSESSGRVERKKRQRRRRNPIYTTPANDTRFTQGLSGPTDEPQASAPMVVEPFATLFRDFREVREAMKPEPVKPTKHRASDGAGPAVEPQEPHPRHPEHRENPDARPFLASEFRFIMSRLMRPNFSVSLEGPLGPTLNDQELLHHALREGREDRRLLLPVLTASFESRLLAESGTFPLAPGGRTVSYPPCRWGAECVGMTEKIDGFPAGRGAVLTALMFPTEYEALLSHGRAPGNPRPCILCCRYYSTDYVLTLQPNYARVDGVHPYVVQCYRNLVDEPDGYLGQCVLKPSTTRFEGFVDPIATFRRSFLRAVRDPQQNGRWVIDQSAMCVRQPAPPLSTHLRVGMPLEHF